MLQVEKEPLRTSPLSLVATWLPRLVIAAVFVTVGFSKFRDPMWVRVFNRIGFGVWFRYVTGALQIVGGVLTLVPRVSLIGIGILACTMAGAVTVWVAFGLVLATLIPGALLVMLAAAGWLEYSSSRTAERRP
jgi:uncharacterized membrane protein YphA (DoxX/SURF4 family)